ncbi:hypothetical protein Goshw_014262 [Gossypium schwendimanii]|uniref:Uncharacterized protein n=1 Tax=Gossypium schwendimanii TaxID=34291 RepID=A0A7J9LW31_GOSSC|nr:hypothetical protein [Gossypium schwendimanii]
MGVKSTLLEKEAINFNWVVENIRTTLMVAQDLLRLERLREMNKIL